MGLSTIAELLAEFGIERPLFFEMVLIRMTQGIFGKDEITLAELRAYDPYAVIEHHTEYIARLHEKGLVLQDEHGNITLSPVGRRAIDRLHTEGTSYVAGRMVLPHETLERLAGELRRCADALAADPALTPRPGSHLAGYMSLSRYGDHSKPMVRIEQAVGELWGARDDVYTAVWREADMEGPPLDVLSHIWSGAATVSDLCEALKMKQTPEDIESSLSWLAEHEYVERDGDSVSMTPMGVMARDDIESETDRLYFAYWPQTTAEAEWTCDTLRDLVAKLLTPQ